MADWLAEPVTLEDSPGCPWCGAKPKLRRALSYQYQHWIECGNDLCFFQPSASDWGLESLIKEWEKRSVK